jgi:hypothetical protein
MSRLLTCTAYRVCMCLSLCVQTELFGSLYLSHTAGLYTTWAAPSIDSSSPLSLPLHLSFTSFVASTGYEALFPLSPSLVSSRTKLSLENSYLSLLGEAISHLFFIAAVRNRITIAAEREPETPLSVPGLQFTDCVNPSPLCEFAFEHQKRSLFS